ncbi:MAG: T9SS type A sorting domain-containing protein [Bacteroidales bacterium]|nr:T9SS type A sorting domain-containing protein [Bacteroidales bacterium]
MAAEHPQWQPDAAPRLWQRRHGGHWKFRIQNSEISVYPNPAREVVYIDGLPVGSSVELYDAFGRQLSAVARELDERTAHCPLPIAHYPNGLYLLRAVTPSGTVYTHKLLIHH